VRQLRTETLSFAELFQEILWRDFKKEKSTQIKVSLLACERCKEKSSSMEFYLFFFPF